MTSESKLKSIEISFSKKGQDIKGSTVGIVGLGGIGQEIAKRLKAFKVGTFLYTGHREKEEGTQPHYTFRIKVKFNQNMFVVKLKHLRFLIGKQLGATFVSLDDLVSRSDFVIVACPLNNETKNLFDKTVFAKMKKTSVFINVSRGG